MQPLNQDKTEFKAEQNQFYDALSLFNFLSSLNRGSNGDTTLVIAFMGLVGFLGTSMMFVVTMAMPRTTVGCLNSYLLSVVHPTVEKHQTVKRD